MLSTAFLRLWKRASEAPKNRLINSRTSQSACGSLGCQPIRIKGGSDAAQLMQLALR